MKRAALALTVFWMAGCGGDGGANGGDGGGGQTDAAVEPAIVVDLVVDTNRNGVLEPGMASEDTGEDGFSASAGAIMLANMDDDNADKKLDSSDEVVNGDDDLADFARFMVRPWSKVPEGATGIVTFTTNPVGRVRIFRLPPPSTDGLPPPAPTVVGPNGAPLTAADILAGVTFAIEAKGFTSATWNGEVALKLVISDVAMLPLGEDTAKLRVAPFILSNNIDPTPVAYVANLRDAESNAFQASLRPGVEASGAQLVAIDSTKREYTDRFGSPDQWTQDHWETGYTFMPAANGSMQSMHVVMRAATEPRPAADYASLELLGKDYGFVHPRASDDPQTHDVSMDSTGNLDAIPPYVKGDQKWPFGRVLIGEGQYRQPDQTVVSYLAAQKVQGVVKINTEFLTVGHVDEIVSFTKAPTPRGWKLLIASPRLARQMLMDAVAQSETNASAVLFQGKNWIDWQARQEVPAAVSIRAILDNAELMAANQEAQIWIDEARTVLKNEIGLEDSEIVELPFLFEGEEFGDQSGSVTLYVAYIPGTVNALVLNDHLIHPDPFGPIVGGADILKRDLGQRMGALGMQARFADAWDLYHRMSGEVHCGTNVTRDIPTGLKWWEMTP